MTKVIYPAVKVYSTPTCPWCVRAKEFFKENRIKFTDVDVAEDDNEREQMIEKSGQLGVPVIEIGSEIIIGFDLPKIKKALGI